MAHIIDVPNNGTYYRRILKPEFKWNWRIRMCLIGTSIFGYTFGLEEPCHYLASAKYVLLIKIKALLVSISHPA